MTTIYALKDPRDGRVRYVGRSRDPQGRLLGHLNGTVPAGKRCREWIQELLAAGAMPELIIMEQAIDEDAPAAETRAISRFKASASLLNTRTSGAAPGPWKRPPQEQTHTVAVDFSIRDHERILRFVDKHGFGTVSTFMRHAAVRLMRSRR